MIEKVYKMSDSDKSVIEPVIKDENINFMHMVLLKGEALKTHYTNANVYMTVVKGTLSLSLENGNIATYENNTVIKIPFNTKMDAKNLNEETLELFVVKAPAPGEFYSK